MALESRFSASEHYPFQTSTVWWTSISGSMKSSGCNSKDWWLQWSRAGSGAKAVTVASKGSLAKYCTVLLAATNMSVVQVKFWANRFPKDSPLKKQPEKMSVFEKSFLKLRSQHCSQRRRQVRSPVIGVSFWKKWNSVLVKNANRPNCKLLTVVFKRSILPIQLYCKAASYKGRIDTPGEDKVVHWVA